MANHVKLFLFLLISIIWVMEVTNADILPSSLAVLGSHKCIHLDKNIKTLENNIFDSRYHIIYNTYNVDLTQCLHDCCSSHLCNAVHFGEDVCIGMNIPAMLLHFNVHRQEVVHVSKRSIIPRPNNGRQTLKSVPCERGSQSCPLNEYCKVTSMQGNGICTCVNGASRNLNNICLHDIPKDSPIIPTPVIVQSNLAAENPIVSNTTLQTESRQTTPVAPLGSSETPLALVVNINSKTIELKPGSDMYKSWATLSAYAIGDNDSNYTYKWTLLNKPKNDEKGSVKDINKQTVALLNLVVGVYQFKVEVTGPNAFGEAVGNITIVPTKHRNEAPIAIISPANMTVKLPNSAVILDGSESSDDDEIKSFHWDIVMGPIAYKLANDNGRTLELKDLIAGNYTIMLEVEDKDGQKGKDTATLSVVKETDYPPTANAGGDKIIYLPVDNLILNGTLSSDDHGIKEWEWTKGPEDSGNAVDMQFTRKPTLQLSNLEEGHYHFILKVVDTSDQVSTSGVHVYVHSPLDSIPVANGGKNITLIIPNTSTELDGSSSNGISPTTHFIWKQLSGPKMATLVPVTNFKVNVTDLTKGESVFQLTLWNGNDSMKNSTSNVTINVVQEKNVPPVANAGQDFKVTLPTSAVIVNGSLSKDDVAITKWLWKRDETSLAAGNVIDTSYNSPILLFTNVVPGRYVWNLTVWDDQGASSSDTVSIIVENPPYLLDEIEIIVGVGIESLSVAQKESCIQKLQLLSSVDSDDVQLQVDDIRGIPLSGKTSLVIVGRRGKIVVSGTVLARQLKSKILNPSNPRLLDLPIIAIETVVCQNNCSGHGECIKASRQCRCNSWWMESIFRRRFGDRTPNCDWSVIYVFVGVLGSTLITGIFIWLAVIYGSRKCRSTSKKRNPRYLLLDNHDETRLSLTRNHIDSDSESGSDVLFDARKPRGSKADRRTNGHVKFQRLRT